MPNIADNIKVLEDAAKAQVQTYDPTLVPCVGAFFELLGGFLADIEAIANNTRPH